MKIQMYLFLFLILGTILLSGCTDTKRYYSNCASCRDSWQQDINRSILNYNSSEHQIDYEDLRFDSSTVKRGSATAEPQFATFLNNTIILKFSSTVNQEAFLNVQLPHNRIYNTMIYPHFHWTPTNINMGYVQWCIEYTCANINDVFPSTIIKCELDQADGIINKHQMTTYLNGNLTIINNLTKSAMCLMRIFRNATSTKDSYNSLANLLEFDIHYEYLS